MSYLSFEFIRTSPTGKTEVWAVNSASSGEKLGEIRWFGRWRQYAFYPELGTLYNPDCLREIATRCSHLMAGVRGRRASL